MLTNPPVPYDLCISVPISHHVYLLCLGAHLALCLKSVPNVKALYGF